MKKLLFFVLLVGLAIPSFAQGNLMADVSILRISFLALILFLPSGFLGRWLAEQKGYSTTAWFWLCWLCGIPALIAICGAPNKHAEKTMFELKRLLENKSNAGNAASFTPISPSAGNTGETWYCKKCKEGNPLTASFCKGCGQYK